MSRLQSRQCVARGGRRRCAATEIEAVLRAPRLASAIAYNSSGQSRAAVPAAAAVRRQRSPRFDSAIELDPAAVAGVRQPRPGAAIRTSADIDAAIACVPAARSRSRPIRPGQLERRCCSRSASPIARPAREHRCRAPRLRPSASPRGSRRCRDRAGVARRPAAAASATFRPIGARHAVAVFAEPLLAAHDRAPLRDLLLPELCRRRRSHRPLRRAGRRISSRSRAMSDAEAAQRIRADAIDILVDLERTHGAQPLAAVLSQAGAGPGHLARLSGQRPGCRRSITVSPTSFTDPPGSPTSRRRRSAVAAAADAMVLSPYVEAPEVGPLPGRDRGRDHVRLHESSRPRSRRTALALWARHPRRRCRLRG